MARRMALCILALLAASTFSLHCSAKFLYDPPPGFKAPPDTVPLLPPPGPKLPDPNVGPIASLADVCKVCTSKAYTPDCMGDFTARCLKAQKIYREQILGIPDNICHCYQAIGTELLDSCPGAVKQLAWLGNCDNFCYYGVRCPIIFALYSLASPKYARIANDNNPNAPKPAPRGSALVVVKFRIDQKVGHDICYRFYPSDDLPAVQSVVLYHATIAQTGTALVKLMASGSSPAKACISVQHTLIKALNDNSTSFYVQVNTAAGAVRGQLVATPRLMTAATSVDAGARCGGKLCVAVADMAFSLYSAKYQLNFTRAVGPRIAANLVAGNKGQKGGNFLVSFYGPGKAAVSDMNSVTPDPNAIIEVLKDPPAHYLNVSTNGQPSGALRGQLSDSLTVFAVLYGYQVQPPSGVSGTGVFLAQIGGGGICYEFQFLNVPVQPTYAYLHRATYSSRGPIVLSTTLEISDKMKCLQADTEQTGSIITKAGEYYVQVYTEKFNKGLLRGQLYVAPVQVV
ncbi:hypothetical protein CLOM_g17553 [Closterium sp. NIES-68]|nr:hypothetical protein CLOM_g17553 [Closterium sp. NIES-68]GJP62697.1 hypothetical protein CLOP_g19729 [Closterium sp. NIES-67]